MQNMKMFAELFVATRRRGYDFLRDNENKFAEIVWSVQCRERRYISRCLPLLQYFEEGITRRGGRVAVFHFITAKVIIVNRRSEKKGKQRFPAVLPEMGTAQKLYVKQK